MGVQYELLVVTMMDVGELSIQRINLCCSPPLMVYRKNSGLMDGTYLLIKKEIKDYSKLLEKH